MKIAKYIFIIIGMYWSCGILSRKGVVANEDADIVKRMKSAGAILIGVTNIPELNLWIESRNYVYGQTNNPYNTNRIAGGSSGGEVIFFKSFYLENISIIYRNKYFRLA